MPSPTRDELLAGMRRRYCPVCDTVFSDGFEPGPGGRPGARCGRCGSLERHRFFVLLLDLLRPSLPEVDFLLEVAPAAETARYMSAFPARRRVRLDLGADNRRVDVLGSLTDLPHPDASVDLLVCYHVLEHVPDDKSAMAEIARVLKPGGIGLVQVPFRPGTPTDEDPDAPREERIRRFGQDDHVRFYGDDFEERLVAAGLTFRRVTPRTTVGDRACIWMNMVPDETVWLVQSLPGVGLPDPGAVPVPSLAASFDRMLGQLAGQTDRLRSVRRERNALRAQVTRGSLPRRALRRLRRTVGGRG